MPNEQSLAALAQLALIQEVDTARAAAHDFKLPAAHRSPADLVADLTAQLAIFDGAARGVMGADRLAATRIRNAALDAAQLTLARVRFYYCCASLDVDQSPELARIGFQPRRDPTAAASNSPAPNPPTPPTA